MMPADVSLTVAQDRSPSIRASLHEAELTLVIAVILVVLVVLVFLRNVRAALIPSVALPVSLIATFALLQLFGFPLTPGWLMAQIVAEVYGRRRVLGKGWSVLLILGDGSMTI